MKIEELKRMKETFLQLQSKRDEVLEIKKEISELEKLKVVKRYLKLQDILKEKTTGCNTGYNKYTNEDLIFIALDKVDITPNNIYVYLGTYKYNIEPDIVHGTSDIPVSRTCKDADYVIYRNLESKHDETIEIPYKKVDEFESSHKIIIPQNVTNKVKYFYDLQAEYFQTMILESQEKAMEKINKLIK